MDWLYGPAKLFLGHPERAWMVAGVFVLWFGVSAWLERAGWQAASKLLLMAAGAWGVFGALEWSSMSQKANIRVDLLLTWPLLCVLSVWYIARWIRSLRQTPAEA